MRLLLIRRRVRGVPRFRRRWFRRPVWQNRAQHGAWRTTVRTMMAEDPEEFFRHLRMTPEIFAELLARLTPRLRVLPGVGRITPGERLALTLQ
ncbi:hypothetical protein ONE63_003518 [Megalurothrips usitatus]|uniref:Uncharacterized protein n=1 Tax=Megalurothrips usitatus TaxID=439358 RepID=A0AAV7X6D0_9NEOP|nr:hypothetical protein ONE63_003518 [Megalurothrips usitatus]